MFYVIVGTKGGTAKTFTGTQVVAPWLYQKQKGKVKPPITLYEVDNNNKSIDGVADSSILAFESFDVSKGTEKLQEEFLDVLTENKDIIIDAGGGDDTRAVIKALDNIDAAGNIMWFVPVMKNIENKENTRDTYNLIREFDKEGTIVFALSAVRNIDDANSVAEDFCFYLGDDEDPGLLNELNDKNMKIVVVGDNIAFDKCKQYRRTLFEIATAKLDTKAALLEAAKEAKEKNDKSIYADTLRLTKLTKQAREIVDNNFSKIFDVLG